VSVAFRKGLAAGLIWLGLLCGTPAFAQTPAGDGLLFGVFPHMPATRLLRVFSPIAEDFSRALGRPVRLRTRPHFTQFAAELQAETYDIAFIQPLDYVWLSEHHGYLPLARRNAPLQTVIIVNGDSPLKTLQDLKGRTLAQAAPRAAVTQIIAAALKAEGFDLEKDIRRSYSTNHFACIQKVLTGEADACGTALRALAHWRDVKPEHDLRIIYRAPVMPHALFVVHPRVPEAQRRILLETILSWPSTETGREILSRGKLLPFTRATDADYDPVRRFEFEAPNPE
jgi:ABC-type phosphate/phosphonate transport system substrate-binding protein